MFLKLQLSERLQRYDVHRYTNLVLQLRAIIVFDISKSIIYISVAIIHEFVVYKILKNEYFI